MEFFDWAFIFAISALITLLAVSAAFDSVNRTSGKRHELKTKPEHFDKTWKKEKLFEVRKNDRKFQKGDLLVLKEYLGKAVFAEEKNKELVSVTKELYSGREIVARVTGVFDVSDCFANTAVLTIKVVKKRKKVLKAK